ncbi:serine/threonine/tyrosine-interacting protein isoform X2 [Vidua chalybeata]|uniref:serine/threonine/tyrosine-interacting protein isoform X2 n=1 Tax=Vidua chalybeata TaxID=81927 RepID=UPI0023A82E03|nr:serine/threonine/tyrosine-interacting protein isoform X2 [Vidua chalybeata]
MELAKPAFPALPQAKEDSEDWTYPMRREMQEILPGLFLGPYSSAMKSKLPILQKHGITHVICIRQNIEANFIKPNFQQLFRYLVLDIADNPVENIIRFFPMTKEFIDGSLQSGGKVLVHGNAGISRSAALVIAYIMETFGVKYRDAFTYVQERRFCINPNAGFVHQLQIFTQTCFKEMSGAGGKLGRKMSGHLSSLELSFGQSKSRNGGKTKILVCAVIKRL